jgi:hypothetical protein
MTSFAPIPMFKDANILNPVLQAAVKSKGKVLPWLAKTTYETTGWLPGMKNLSAGQQKEVAKTLRLGRHGVAERTRAAQTALDKAKADGSKFTAWRKQRELNRLKAEGEWQDLTGGTLPGAGKALLSQPGKVLGTGLKSMGPIQKGMMGYFGLSGVRDAMQTPQEAYGQPGFKYKSRLHQLGGTLGESAAWLAAGPLGLGASLLSFPVGGAIGGLPGRVIASPPPPMPPGY